MNFAITHHHHAHHANHHWHEGSVSVVVTRK
jgi:hypothetical protein